MRLWFPMMVVSMVLYLMSNALARVRVLRNPGLTGTPKMRDCFSVSVCAFRARACMSAHTRVSASTRTALVACSCITRSSDESVNVRSSREFTIHNHITVVGRGQFAMSEFMFLLLNLIIGPFLAFARFMVSLAFVEFCDAAMSLLVMSHSQI
jgi:hypothetical protein